MRTDFDFPDPPARIEMAKCYDCPPGSDEQAVEGYLLTSEGLVPFCYEHYHLRQRKAQQRTIENYPD